MVPNSCNHSLVLVVLAVLVRVYAIASLPACLLCHSGPAEAGLLVEAVGYINSIECKIRHFEGVQSKFSAIGVNDFALFICKPNTPKPCLLVISL
jgi:hypothetical protein